MVFVNSFKNSFRFVGGVTSLFCARAEFVVDYRLGWGRTQAPFQRDLPVSEEYEYLAPKKLTKKERVRYGKKTEGL